ncbi:MAG: acyl carrier protein [Verrucomicrobia bacterium]|nr:acyl carrier protein [Verrucomicrobiota bacterium]
MDNAATLRQQVKQMLVENLMLPCTVDDLGDDQLLFGPGSLGLDSVDALQLVVALDKNHGLRIPDPDTARTVLQSVRSIAEALERHLGAQG